MELSGDRDTPVRFVTWSAIADWWRREVDEDPAYGHVVTPLLMEVLQPKGRHSYLDLGCGEGRVMREVDGVGAIAFGIDINRDLLAGLERVMVAELPGLPLRDNCLDGVYCVLTLEHIEDHITFFSETARVVRPGGVMALVANHPTWTAPGSTPISDDDGEVLWRPGEYFSSGITSIPAGEAEVTFYHRSMSALLDAAARGGWHLQRMIEQPHHELTDQGGIPRIVACRWTMPQT